MKAWLLKDILKISLKVIQFELQFIAVSHDCFLENWYKIPSLKSFFKCFFIYTEKWTFYSTQEICFQEYVLKQRVCTQRELYYEENV